MGTWTQLNTITPSVNEMIKHTVKILHHDGPFSEYSLRLKTVNYI